MTEEENKTSLPSDTRGFLGMEDAKPAGRQDSFVRPPSFAAGTDDFDERTKKERQARFRASADMLFSTDVSKLDDAGASALYQSVSEGMFGLSDEDGSVAFGKRASKDPRANIDMLRKFVRGDYALIEDPEYTKWRQMDEEAKFRYALENETVGNSLRSYFKGERGPSVVEIVNSALTPAPRLFGPLRSDVERETQRKMRYEDLTDEEKEKYRADVIGDYDEKLSRRQTLATFLQFAHGLSDKASYVLAKSFNEGKIDAAAVNGNIDDEDERERVYSAFSLMRGDQKKGRILGIETDFTDGTAGNRLQLGLYGLQQSVVGLVTDTGEMARDAAAWTYAKVAMDEQERRDFFKGWDANSRAEQAMKQNLPEADSIWGEAFQGVAENAHWFIPYSMIGKGGRMVTAARGLKQVEAVGWKAKLLKPLKDLKTTLTPMRLGGDLKNQKATLEIAKAGAESAAAATRAAWTLDVNGTKKLGEMGATILSRQMAAVDRFTQALRGVDADLKAAKWWKDATGTAMWAAGEASAFSAFASEYIANADAAGISREESVLTAAAIGLINAKIEQLYVPGLESSLTPAQVKSLTFTAMAQAIKTDGAKGFRKWLANRVSKGIAEGMKVTLTEGAVEEPLQQMAIEHGKAFDRLCQELRDGGDATLANEAKALWESFAATLPDDYATFIDTAADMVPSSIGFGVTTIGNQTRRQHIHNALTRHMNRRAGSTSTMATAQTMQELQGATDYDAGLVDVIQQAVNVRAAVEKHWQGEEDGSEAKNPHRFEEAMTAARRAWRDPQTGDAVQEIADAAGVDVKTAEVLAQYLQTEAEASAFSPQARAWASLNMSLADIDEATIKTVLPGYVEGSFASDPENGVYSGRVKMGDGTERTIAYRVGDISAELTTEAADMARPDSPFGKSFDARHAEAGDGVTWASLSDAQRYAEAVRSQMSVNGSSTGRGGVFELTDASGEKVRVNADDVIYLANGRIGDVGYGPAATQGTVRHETFHSLWRFVRATLEDADVQQLAKTLGVDVTEAGWEVELDERMAHEMERYASGHYVSHAVSSRFDRMLDSWAGKVIDFFGKFGPSDEVTDPKTGKPYQLKGLYDSILRGELGSGALGVELRKVPKQTAERTATPTSSMPVEVTDADRAAQEAEARAEADESAQAERKVVQPQTPKTQGKDATADESGAAAQKAVHTSENPADAATPNQRYYKVGLPNSGVKLVGRLEVRDADDGLITSTDAEYHDRGNQNRDDKSEESRALVEKIGANPDPLQVGTVQPIASNGIVWALPNGDVIIGNHRVNGVRLGYRKGTAAALEKFVREDAARRGIEIGDDVKRPLAVFVLERIEDPEGKADVHEVVRLANESQNRGFNVREQAANDAKVLVDNNLLPRMEFRPDGRIDETRSDEAIGVFRRETGAQGMVGEDGMLTEEGQTRIQNAALAALLGGEGNNALLNKIMANAGRLDMAGELRALMKTTPELMALAEAKPAYDLRRPLAEALQLFTEWRDKDETLRTEKGRTRHDWRETKDGNRVRGLSWEAFMSQGDMFRTPSDEARILGDLFAKAESLRSFDREDVESAAGKKRVVDLVSDYIFDYIENARAVNTETEDMFGGVPATVAEVLAAQRATGGATGGADGGVRFSIAGAYKPRSNVPAVRGGWNEKKILRYLKANPSLHGVRAAARLISEFDTVDELKDHMFYHGTRNYVGPLSPSMTQSERWAQEHGGGGYGQRYWGISISKSKRIASNFGNPSPGVSIYPVVLARGAKVIDRPDLTDAADVEDHIVELWNDGVDAVRLGDWKSDTSEQELLVLNPRAICNIGTADSYRYFRLGSDENPLDIKDDAHIARMLEAAREYADYSPAKRFGKPVRPSLLYPNNADGTPGGLKPMEVIEAEKAQYEKDLAAWRKSEQGIAAAEYERKMRDTIRYSIAQTETPQFKNWFRGSKVVDEDGEPLVVYRGAQFDPLAQEPGKGVIKPEAYFTADPEYAKRYGNVRAYYLRIEHPFDIRDPECLADLKRVYPDHEFARGSSGALDWAEASTVDGEFLRDNFGDKYDGIIYDEGGDPAEGGPKHRGISYVPLDGGAQVKLAIGNNGDFSSHPDARYSISGIYTGAAADYANRSRQGGVDDGPSLLKIGTGEGAQVYGWGLYGSTVRGVAEGYAKDAREYNAEKNGKRIDLIFPKNMLEAETAKRLMENGGDVSKTIEKLKRKGIGSAIIKELEEHGAEYSVAPKHEHLYEQTFFTDRAPGDESHLLKWYDAISDANWDRVIAQAEKEGLREKLKGAWWLRFNGDLEHFITDNGNSSDAIYERLSKLLGGPQSASEFLARAGIDGVKYPVDSYGGKGVKNGDEVGWNYVSFRDDNIRVDHKWTDGQMRFSVSAPAVADPDVQVEKESADRRYSVFAGEKTASPHLLKPLAEAKAMLGDGEYTDAERREIYDKTGWWRGKDGKWRVELPNLKAKYFDADESIEFADADVILEKYGWNEYSAYWLRDLVTFPKGLKANTYELGETLVFFVDEEQMKSASGGEDASAATFVRVEQGLFGPQVVCEIHVADPMVEDRERKGKQRLAQSTLDSLTHELQHVIQLREGFAFGGNTSYAGGVRAYGAAAGEVEARNAARRNDQEKRALPPWETEDVPARYQSVGYSGWEWTDADGWRPMEQAASLSPASVRPAAEDRRYSISHDLVEAMERRERRALEPREPQGESPFFAEAEDAVEIPIRALRTLKDEQERSIRSAAFNMRRAAAGRIPKRAPVSVVENGDGTYTVVDGNATTWAAARGGLETVRAKIVGKNRGTRLANSMYIVAEERSNDDEYGNLHADGFNGLDFEAAREKAYAQAAENAPLLKTVVEAAAKAVGGEAMHRKSLKGRERADDKARSYRAGYECVIDIIGGTITLDPSQDMTDALKAIRSNLPEGAHTARVKSMSSPDSGGYWDIKVSVRFANGGIGEIILVDKNINEAKFNRGGHELYDYQRELEPLRETDENADRLWKALKKLELAIYSHNTPNAAEYQAAVWERAKSTASSQVTRLQGKGNASISSGFIGKLKELLEGSHLQRPASLDSYATPARSFIQNDISDSSFMGETTPDILSDSSLTVNGKFDKGEKLFSTEAPRSRLVYPQLQGMTDDELLSAAVAARIALGRSEKVSDRSVKLETVRKMLARLHPDWDKTKMGVETLRVIKDAQKLAKTIRGDLDRGVSESLVLRHLPDRAREQFGREMRQEAREGARLGAFGERAETALEERQAKVVEDAVRVQTGLDSAAIENAFGINLSETIMHLAENPLTENNAQQGATGAAAEGEGSAEEDGEGAAEQPAAEIDAKVKAVVDDIVSASGQQAGVDEQNRKARRAAAARDAEREADVGEDAEGADGQAGFDQEDGDALAEAVKKSALDLENPRHLARFVAELARRQWIKEHGLALTADVWRDLVAVQFLRKTAQSVYAKLCRDLVYSRSRETAMQRIAKLDNVPTVAGLISEMEFVGALINAQRIRDTQKAMCEKLDLFLRQAFGAQGRFRPDKEEGKRSVSAEAELRARYMRHAMWLTPDAAAEEARQLQQAIDALSVDFQDAGRDRDQSREFVETIRKLNVLREFGALRYKPVGEIEAAVQWWQDFARGESDDIVREMYDRDIRTKKAAHLLAVAFADPKRTTIREGGKADALNRFITGHMGFVSLLQDCMRHASDADAAAVKDIVDYIAREVQKAGDRSEAEKRRHNDAFHSAVEGIYGKGFNAVMKDMMAPDERFAKYMGVVGGKRVTPTKGRALQLLVSLLQEGRKIEVEDEENPGKTKTVWEGGYHDNIVKHHREGQAAEIMRLLDPADMNMLKWLGQWYELNRSDLSQVCHSLFGIGVYAELPNYFPVKMMLETQGLEKGQGVGWTIFPKALTPRVRNERDFDTSADIFSMWAARMEEAAQWKHHAQLGLEMRGIFGRAELREAVRANHGASVDELMQGFITDILAGHGAYDRSTAGVQYFSDQIRGWTALCALGGNIGVMAKQTTSIPAFGFEIGLVNTAKYITSAFTPEGMAAMGRIWNSEQRRTRWNLGSSEAVRNALDGRNANILKRMLQASMVTNKLGDVVPALVVGQGIYRDCLDRGMSEDDAMAETWSIIERTQQSGRMENQTSIQRRNKLGRIMFQFLSTQQQYLQYEVRAIREVIARPDSVKRWGDLGRAILLNHFILSSAYYWMGQLYKYALGQEPPEDELKDWVISCLLGPYGSLFVAGFCCKYTLERAIKGYSIRGGSSMLPMESWLKNQVNDGAKLLEAIFDSDGDTWDNMLDAAGRWMSDSNSTVRDLRKIYRYRVKGEPQKRRK